MVWTVIPDSDIDPDSPITTGLMTALRDNVASAFAKDSGAPVLANNYIVQAMINAGEIGQNELKTTTNTLSTTSTSSSGAIATAGGAYSFLAQFYNSGAGTSVLGAISSPENPYSGTNTAPTRSVTFRATSGTAYYRETYIQASPPYDLGDGVVGRFIFVIIDDTTGEIESVYNATEAPWHYNGPTDIRGKLAADGKKYRTRKDMSGHELTLAQARLNIGTLRAYNAAFRNAPVIQEEITQDIKQADMNLIPHPFIDNDLTGKTVVMLDPVSDLNFELDELSQHAEFSINDLLHDGYLEIGNTGLSRSGPSGVLIPSFKWKDTI